jgi:glycosyltransferase involved in cell wall biosynthesis
LDKVLLFTDCYIYGGSERLAVYILGNEQVNKAFEMVFSYRKFELYEGPLNYDLNRYHIRATRHPLTLLANDTRFYNLDRGGNPAWVNKVIKLPFTIFQKSGLYFLYNFITFLALLRKVRPDILHINNGGYPGSLRCNHLLMAARCCGIKSIVYQVNNIASKGKSIFSRYQNAYVDRNVQFFVTASLRAKEALVKERGFSPSKMVTIPNSIMDEGVSLGREALLKKWDLPENAFLLVQVAFLTGRKGQIHLLKAVLAIKNMRIPGLSDRIKVMLVGDGEDEKGLRSYISENGLTGTAILTGYQDNPADFVSAADVFLLPSIANEDMPLAMLTAMSIGKPIIASRFAGIAEAIREEYEEGILLEVDPSTMSDQICRAVLRLYENPGVGDRLAGNARKRYLDEYSQEAYGKRFRELYQKVMASTKP